MKKYQEGKAKARQEAIDWQIKFSENNYSYEELSQYTEHFLKLGAKYGLIKEFKREGIL